MDVYQFRELDEDDQAQTAWQYGEHIATRMTLLHTVSLWQIEGFYVEIFFNQADQKIEKLRSFRTTILLTPYLKQIDISSVFY